MTVYVDDMLLRQDVPYGNGVVRGTWSHLIADTQPELHEFAARLGLKRSWFQDPLRMNKPPLSTSLRAQMWHYDVTKTKREEAIRLGAVPVTQKELNVIIRQRHALLYPEAAKPVES